MKKIFITLIVFSVYHFTHAQVSQRWVFDNVDAFNYYPTTNIIASDDEVIVCSQSANTLHTAYVFLLDSTGNLLSQDSVNNFDYSILYNKRMVRDMAGSIYLCGTEYDSLLNSKIRLIKYDSQLNRQWDVSFRDTNTQTANSMGLLYSQDGNNLYLIGQKYDTTTRTIILSFDTAGNILWQAQDTTTSSFIPISYATDHSGNVIIGGYAFLSSFGTAEDFLIWKTDSSGQLAWMIRENGNFNSDDAVTDLCIDSFDNIIATGRFEDSVRIQVFKYSTSGNRTWASGIPEVSLNKVAVDGNGNVYIVGTDTVPDHEFIIHKLDSSGNYAGSVFSDLPDFTVFNQDYFRSLTVSNENEIYVLHAADSSSLVRWLVSKLNTALNIDYTLTYPGNQSINSALSSDLFILDDAIIVTGKIDNFLRIVYFEESITTNVSILTDEPLLVWPNPAGERLFISSTSEILSVRIINSSGQVAMSGRYDSGIELKGLAVGLYTVLIESQSGIRSARFIRQ